MHVHVCIGKIRELQLEYLCMRCSEHEADAKGHRIVQKSTKMPKTTAKKSAKKNPKKTAKSVTTERRVTRGRRTPQNTRRQDVIEPVRKCTRRNTNNADAVPPKWSRSSRSLTEADIPRIVNTFIAAQDKRRHRRPTRDSDTKDGHSEDSHSDSVSDLDDSGDELLTDEDFSGKNCHA